jgi:hypothetical protein
MLYAFLVFYGLLTGGVSGWFMYNASAGKKRDRVRSAILWGVGMGLICVICAIGG